MRLMQVDVTVAQLGAISSTHMRSDRPDGFADIMQRRWQSEPAQP